jgi:homoserine dehydrogenase
LSNNQEIGIGVLGCGTVGCAVVQELLSRGLADFKLRKVLVKDLFKPRDIPALTEDLKKQIFTTEAKELLNDPEIALVIEVMAGDKPALDYCLEALKAKKHYVTANKELIAKHGPQIFATASENKVQVRLDATVGGGIPVINTMLDSLRANRISEVVGILNGTTNYILTAMKEGQDFAEALQQAQELGYAEPDPTNDVEGIDTKYKISILSSLAFHNYIAPDDVQNEGITKISAKDFHFAKNLNFTIKLLGVARRLSTNAALESTEDKISIGVYPALISSQYPLSQVDGATNAIQIRGHLIQQLLLVGPGAGPLATSSAILGDALSITKQNLTESHLPYKSSAKIDNHSPNNKYRFYVRLLVDDEAGVIGQVGNVLAKFNVSLSSIDQEAEKKKPSKASSKAAETKAEKTQATLILLTHLVTEDVFVQAMKELEKLACIKQVACWLRVFE